ncbi:MAG: hypothetical protein WC620_06700 [Methanoregula sp.]|jgi:hypothetical protein
MGISDTIETTISQVQRVIQIEYCVFPALFGLFMILWGIFFNEWDWTLIGVGLAIFLIFGWYTYRVITGKDS